MNSHFEVSRRISSVLFESLCWLMSVLPPELTDHLDVVAERLHAAQAVVDIIHLPAAHDGIGPEEARNRRLDGIGADRQIDCGHGRVAFLLAGARAGKADVAREDRKHRNGTARLFAVGLPLRAPAL